MNVAVVSEPVRRPSLPTAPRFWLAVGGSVALGMLLAVVGVAGAIHLLYRAPRVAGGNGAAADQTSRQAAPGKLAGRSTDDAAGTKPPAAPASDPGAVPPEGTANASGRHEARPPADAASPAGAAAVAASPSDSPATLPSSPASGLPAATDERVPNAANMPQGIAPAPFTPRPAEGGGIEALARFDRFLGGDDTVGATPVPPSAEASSPSSAAPAAPASPSVGDGRSPPHATTEPAAEARPVAPRPPPRTVDVPKRLADPLMLVQTSGTPLVEFLQLFSDLSTIPITLQPDALPLVRLTPLSPVSIDSSATTVGGALTAALRPLGLEAVAVGDQLIVRVIEPEKLRTIEYPTKDLADDEAGRIALAQLLQAVVEPSSWGDEEGQGSIALVANQDVLRIRQRQAVHAVLVIGCEKLRVARGKPPASSRYDPALFALDSRRTRAAEKLGRKVTANFRQPTRLVTILQRLGELTGTTILVDWNDLASLEWNPQAEASVVLDDLPLADALDALLRPMDLAWRIVDGQTLQVVSPQRLATQGELEVYPVGPLADNDPQGQQLLARVQATLGEETFAEGGVVRYDQLGRCLLAWLPQPKQRQLEETLQHWQKTHGAATPQ